MSTLPRESMTAHAELFAALAAPFDGNEVKARTQGGRQLSYVTARTVMNRLDQVLGPENWWDSYRAGGDASILCSLTVRLPDGETVTKMDAGGFAGMQDQGDDDKSGYSDAFKRAAVKFGIARYLYKDGVPSFVSEPSGANGNGPSGQNVHLNGHGPTNRISGNGRAVDAPPKPTGAKCWTPMNGRELFAWAKDQERESPGLFKFITDFGVQHEFPRRMVDWNPTDAQRALAEARTALERMNGDDN